MLGVIEKRIPEDVRLDTNMRLMLGLARTIPIKRKICLRLLYLFTALLIVFSSSNWSATLNFSIERYDMSSVSVVADQFIAFPSLIDVNGDGDLDIVGTSWDFFTDARDPAYVMLNNGSGQFTFDQQGLWTPPPTVGSQHWPLVEDFNQDGRIDLYVFGMGNEGSQSLDTWFAGTLHQLFLNGGANGLIDSSAQSLLDDRRSVIHSATSGDIDGDGDIDIFNAAINVNRPNLFAQNNDGIGSFFWINDGAGVFTANKDRLPESLRMGCLELGCTDSTPPNTNIQDSLLLDIDRDGDLDLLLTIPFQVDTPDELRHTGEAFLVLLNDGAGHFLPRPMGMVPDRSPSNSDFFSYNLSSSDVNSDGWPDVFLSVNNHNLEDGNLNLFLNNGDGSFSDATGSLGLDPFVPQNSGVGGYVLRLFLNDFNGDKWPDFLILGSGIKPKLAFNNGDGTFTEATSILGDFVDDEIFLLAVGDIDGDGDLDIISPSPGTCAVFCPALEIARNVSPYSPVEAPALPGIPTLVGPQNNETALPVLRWEHVFGAQSYVIQVSHGVDFSAFGQTDLSIDGITGNELYISRLSDLAGFDGLQEGDRYYWRVAAQNYTGVGEWSEVRNFTVEVKPDPVFKNGFENP